MSRASQNLSLLSCFTYTVDVEGRWSFHTIASPGDGKMFGGHEMIASAAPHQWEAAPEKLT